MHQTATAVCHTHTPTHLHAQHPYVHSYRPMHSADGCSETLVKCFPLVHTRRGGDRATRRRKRRREEDSTSKDGEEQWITFTIHSVPRAQCINDWNCVSQVVKKWCCSRLCQRSLKVKCLLIFSDYCVIVHSAYHCLVTFIDQKKTSHRREVIVMTHWVHSASGAFMQWATGHLCIALSAICLCFSCITPA